MRNEEERKKDGWEKNYSRRGEDFNDEDADGEVKKEEEEDGEHEEEEDEKEGRLDYGHKARGGLEDERTRTEAGKGGR